MRAGQLDRRISLLTATESKDASGGPVESWAVTSTTWAKCTDLAAREFIAAGQTNAEITTKFLIRYRTGITPAMRVRWRERDYDIVAVQETMAGRIDGLEILARARV
jgi:SPP1 family predicted phage head-tail adaptor